MLYRPREIASELGIASSTLRLWSVLFAAYLSPPARRAPEGGAAPRVQRRYTDEDLELLRRVKEFLFQGFTYDEAGAKLSRTPDPVVPSRSALEAVVPSRALSEVRVTPEGDAPSLVALQEALAAKDKTIATLKESLGFLEAYLRAVRLERDEARERAVLAEKELEELRSDRQQARPSGSRSWLKQVISGM